MSRPPPQSADGVAATTTQRGQWSLAIIVLVGAWLRAAYLWEQTGEPDFRFPPVDAGYHDYWARALASGDWSALPEDAAGRDPLISTTPFFRPPGYPYFLALLYALTGSSYIGARALQMLLGLANILLAYRLGHGLFDRTVALAFAACMAVYWNFIYFEAQFQDPLPLITLGLLLSLTCLGFARRGGAWRMLLAGFLVGLCALFRPNSLVFGLALIFFAWRVVRRRAGRRWPRTLPPVLLALALGAAAAIAPATIRNRIVGGDTVLISANGGINLYIGNNPAAGGRFVAELPDAGRFHSCFDYPAIVARLEARMGRPLRYSDVSRYYAGKALDFIREQPARVFALTLRKALLFWTPEEITHNNVPEWERRHSRVLRYLPAGFAVVLGFALVGLHVWRREPAGAGDGPRQDTLLLVVVLVLAYYLSFIPFFVTSLYRVPIVPFLLLFGARAAVEIARDWRTQRRRAWRLAGAAATLSALLALPLLLRTPEDRARNEARWRFARGVTYRLGGKPDLAIAEYSAGIAAAPRHVFLHNNLAALLYERERYEEARGHYAEALRANPNFPESLAGMANCFLALGRPAEAAQYLERAVRNQPRVPSLRLRFGNALATAGRYEEAAQQYRLVLAADSANAGALCNLGVMLSTLGRHDEAIQTYESALRLRPADATLLANLGIALESKGDKNAAARCYRRALELQPGDSATRARLEALAGSR